MAAGKPQPDLVADQGQEACPILVAREGAEEQAATGLSEAQKAWISANGFTARPGSSLLVPGADGALAAVLYGAPADGPFAAFEPAALRRTLPDGLYRFEGAALADLSTTALGWALEGYEFTEFCEKPPRNARLAVPATVDIAEIAHIHSAVTLVRDLVNMPANLMGPAELADAARDLADRFGAAFSVLVGERLLDRNFPLIHAVGAASDREPRLVDFTWGDASHRKVTLVGKGVCFDTGGLDIKPSNSMLLMKKDMGGAANVLGLAAMIMAAELPVRLRVLIPAVENAVSGSAFRPGDVFRSRKGIAVEIGNTDAEGRLVLADALALADEEAPDLIVDMATLTGAARVATGPDLPPMFTADDAFAHYVQDAGAKCCDPVWRMPLWKPYSEMLQSSVADTSNTSNGPFAGAVTAALFLQRFVEKSRVWAHFDIYAWTPAAKPARPLGGAAQASRALYAALRQIYGPVRS